MDNGEVCENLIQETILTETNFSKRGAPYPFLEKLPGDDLIYHKTINRMSWFVGEICTISFSTTAVFLKTPTGQTPTLLVIALFLLALPIIAFEIPGDLFLRGISFPTALHRSN